MRGKKIKLPVDGLSSEDKAKLRSAIRRVWLWYAWPRKLVVKRCRLYRRIYRCEKCRSLEAKIHVDHIVPIGAVESVGYIDRLYVASTGLQGLCEKCHKTKTKEERRKK